MKLVILFLVVVITTGSSIELSSDNVGSTVEEFPVAGTENETTSILESVGKLVSTILASVANLLRAIFGINPAPEPAMPSAGIPAPMGSRVLEKSMYMSLLAMVGWIMWKGQKRETSTPDGYSDKLNALDENFL
jgi:hypothetical protein